MLELIAQVILCWLASDWLAGFWHWLEDEYFDESWPIIGTYVAKPNQLHHSQPLAFLEGNYWQRNYTAIMPALAAIAVAAWFSAPWQVLLTFAFASQANEIHAWSHMRGKLSRWVVVLQEIGLLQSPRHHGEHHRSPFSIKYCVSTDWLNPILDAVKFWRGLEYLVFYTLRIRSRSLSL
jgi:hypothetical protein